MATCVSEGDDVAGFTLVELLVVVLIIGILAAIAIPRLVGQRERAAHDAVLSDLRNASMQLEANYSDTLVYPPAGPVPGFPPSSVGVSLEIRYSSTVGYCLEAIHPTVDMDDDGSADVYRFDTRVVARMSGIEEGACPPP